MHTDNDKRSQYHHVYYVRNIVDVKKKKTFVLSNDLWLIHVGFDINEKERVLYYFPIDKYCYVPNFGFVRFLVMGT